ncbi:chitinase [Neobacillus notoginsengisoli]|uniref:chitinase n=2 Tax=Neobacillus notoginsengisoli TaxID=1578198 RepID=A0A417YXQ1_9BACI|nr:chitinase [Neobacillus notoginsengisoli]
MIIIIFMSGFMTGSFYTSHMKDKKTVMKHHLAPESEKSLPGKKMPESASSKVVMGYVQDFRNPDLINVRNLTHVIFSFAHPSEDGDVLLNGDMAWENLRKTVRLAHENGSKVILSVGGWYHLNGEESYPYFKKAISNLDSRKKLVESLINIADQENLDGIDIDFEHPRTEADAANLAAFMKELSVKLHGQKKELSVAVNSKINAITGAEVESVIFKPEMFHFADYVNIMAYDGQWDGGYHAENLAPYHFTENVVHYWSRLFNSLEIPKSKLVLGVPLYAQPENINAKQISYATIISKNPDFANKDMIILNGTAYFYNGQKTVRKKTALALSNGFGGMMLWEAGHDGEGNTSMAKSIRSAINDHSHNSINIHSQKKTRRER